MGDLGFIPGLGRFSGEGNSYLLQYSDLENSMDCIESPDMTERFSLFQIYKANINIHIGGNTEKAMAPHSSTLAWKIPWMEEPGRLQSMGSLRVRHN